MLASEIHAAWAHFWPPTETGARQLSRDRKALREQKNDAVRFLVDQRREA
jgi:hypothetical protein